MAEASMATTSLRYGQETLAAQSADSSWTALYTVAGAAALLSVLFIPVQILVFILVPLPQTVVGWFTLLQHSKLVGLIDLDLLLVADNVLLIPILLALYVLLRRTNEPVMAIGTALGFAGLFLFITSNPAFGMLALSNQYTAATTDAERSLFVAAGQGLLVGWQSTAFQVAYVTGSLAGVLVAAVMLQSDIFSKAIAYLGILANVIGFGLYIPMIGVFISVFSVMFLWVWYILLARRFFQLGQGAAREAL